MSTILDTLYKEYRALQEKLQKVGDVILTYGGTLPVDDNNYNEDAFDLQNTMGVYPSNGTWKDKILYTLQEVNQPITVSELAQIVLKHQPEISIGRVANALTQYCSAMGVSGEIGVDKSSFKNKYFLNK